MSNDQQLQNADNAGELQENKERGSLALEHILFIGAIVALSAGLFIFYDNLATYFSGIGFSPPPINVGGPSGN